MEKIIQRLYEIETKAENIVQNASKEKKRLQQESDQKILAFDQLIATDTKERLDQQKKEIDKSLEQEQKALEASYHTQLAKMEEFFTDHHDDLVYKIFKRIIGGSDYVQ